MLSRRSRLGTRNHLNIISIFANCQHLVTGAETNTRLRDDRRAGRLLEALNFQPDEAGTCSDAAGSQFVSARRHAEACLRWLARNPSELGKARKSAKQAIEQSCRAADLIASLRWLVRDTPLSLVKVDINDAIEEVLLLSKRDHAGITIHTELDKSLPNIEADRLQLQQVVLNLVRNAVDAMAEIEGRSRVLTASSKPANEHILVAIADTGHGISPTDQERLFDAFFTTKGKGLGLGLSICRKIVTIHGGRLWVKENLTYGTTFTFTLPLSRSMQAAGSR